MSPDSANDEAAHHEAGHFVASYTLQPDRHRYGLTIVPSDDYGGLATSEGPWMDDGRERIEEAIVGLYAGFAAEVRFAPGEERARWHARSDDEQAADMLKQVEAHPARRAELEQQLRSRAADLITQHWNKVQAIAAELLNRKRLDGTEAELIVDAIDEGLDTAEVLARYRSLRNMEP